VDGHDLDRILAGIHVGQRVKVLDAGCQRGEIGQLARLFQAFEFIQENLRILEVGGVLDASRPTQGEPDAFDSIA